MNIMKAFSLFLILPLISISYAHAQPAPAAKPAASTQTKMSNEKAGEFYKHCLQRATDDKTMTPATKAVFCQCNMVHMQQSMTMEDIEASVGNDQAARNAINKMLVEVYAPCMEYPVRDLLAGQCAKDIPGKPKVCNCISDNMGAYMSKVAKPMFKEMLAKNPNMADPMNALLENPEFKKQQQSMAFSCITTY